MSTIDYTTDVEGIEQLDQLKALALDLGVRRDWHEPDEQGVNAFVLGDHLDNAMGSSGPACGELRVYITKLDEDDQPKVVGAISLATLLAFACGTYQGY